MSVGTRGSTLLVGFHAVLARVRSDPGSVSEILVARGRDDRRMHELAACAAATGIEVRAVAIEHLDRAAGGERHQGVVAFVAAEPSRRLDLDDVVRQAREAGRQPLLLVLDEVQDPHNLGACLRNADALGADAVVVTRDRSAGMTPAVARVAAGAAEAVPLVTVTNLARALDELKSLDVWVIGADAQGGENLFDAGLDGALAWVLGAEGRGLRRLSREKCDRLVAIPQFGTVASLNVSVAAGICLYATQRYRRQARAVSR